MEGQAWPYVMFVVQGAVNLERYDLELCDGGQVGAVEYYGCNLFTDTSALRGSSVGILAGIHTGKLKRLIDTPVEGVPFSPSLAHKLLCLLGEFAMELWCAAQFGAIRRNSAQLF